MTETLKGLAPIRGEYYLIESEKISELYEKAGHKGEEDLPNFITLDGKECLFTENFIEKNGKTYEIVMVANGFSWEDIVVYDDEIDDEEDANA